jgi:PAS domain S-box-containing protein
VAPGHGARKLARRSKRLAGIPPRVAASSEALAEEIDEAPPEPQSSKERDLARNALGAVSSIVPIGVFAADAQGQLWYVNQRLADATGLMSTASLPVTLHLPLHDDPDHSRPQTAPWVTRIVSAVFTSGETVTRLRARVLPQIRPNGTIAGYVGVVLSDGDPASGGDGADDSGGADDGALAAAFAGAAPGEPRVADFTSPLRLRTSERLLERLVDGNPDIVTVLNADGSWRYSNSAAQRLLGFQEDFDPATGLFDLIHPEDLPLALELLARAQAGELDPDEKFEIRLRGHDGTWRYLENTADNLIDDPEVHGIVLRSEDVTERREARTRLLDANERLSTLVGSLHIAALVEDINRVIVLTNDAFVELFELAGPPANLVGRTLDNLGPELTRRFGDPTRAPEPERADRILRERRRVIGDRIFMPDGRVLERDYVPIFVQHEYRGHLWLFRDISGQARNETQWTQLLQTQREENIRLVELDRAKASFLAEISHELRTPLTSILSFTELLRDGVGRDDPAEQVEFLDVITRNSDRLLRLVDDLLLLDRAEAGVLPIEWGTFDVAAVVASAVATFAPRAESKRISLESELSEGLPIPGDANRIAQLIDVLLSNALKFTPEHGRVTVKATPAEDHWFISVADSGIGVPAAERDMLCERFYRASNARAARIPGSGLGLSVARAIAHLHGGEISISESEDGGAAVLIALPMGRRQEPALAGADA